MKLQTQCTDSFNNLINFRLFEMFDQDFLLINQTLSISVLSADHELQ